MTFCSPARVIRGLPRPIEKNLSDSFSIYQKKETMSREKGLRGIICCTRYFEIHSWIKPDLQEIRILNITFHRHTTVAVMDHVLWAALQKSPRGVPDPLAPSLGISPSHIRQVGFRVCDGCVSSGLFCTFLCSLQKYLSGGTSARMERHGTCPFKPPCLESIFVSSCVFLSDAHESKFRK